MVLRFSYIAVLVFTLALQGYPAIAGFTQLVGIDNTPVSLAMRSFIVALSLLLLLNRPSVDFSGAHGIVVTALLAFWAAYFFRLLLASALEPSQLVNGASYYWMWAVGSCFTPMLAIIVSTGWFRVGSNQAFRATILIVTAATAFIYLSVAINGVNALLANGRLQLTALNPITLGHTGAIFALLGVFITFRPNRMRDAPLIVAAGMSMLALGAVIVLGSGSRGAQIGSAVALLFFMSAQPIKRKLRMIAILLFVALALAPSMLEFIANAGMSSLERIDDALVGDDAALTGRLAAYDGAWSVFSESPVFGKSITEPVTGTYPHNIVLEALMATGVAGGVPLLVALLGGVYLGWRMLRRNSPSSWLAMLYVESLTGAMFSGAIYSVAPVWVSLAGLIALSQSRAE
ncbi:O-antigen ligase family protein [Cereibacter azotoformans]|uniref:O-antigen ligase-like membrane protein n=1 Tax=Cereibacter azotoformans TaxID=43057 RepID=A0A2T5JSP9_9RHOB|nr:O-antigen ligase family protein [Cereibacter azotoformans]PTR11625.1 O-antigen ligase-like membrane protein [Cereibacter azotoformans]